jgi:co-chaperonin GroES (HSP10)
MIRPMPGRILTELIPATEQFNRIGLVIVDRKKHFQHPIRKGKVLAIGSGVRQVKEGDVVLFRGDAGLTTDGYESDEIKNENFQRWLKEHECLAVEEGV